MDADRLPKSVKEIVVLHADQSGALTGTTIFRRRAKGRKKGTVWLRPMERMTNDMAEAMAVSATEYVRRHHGSNRKRRDGWMRDAGTNVMRAAEKGAKRLKFSRFVMPF